MRRILWSVAFLLFGRFASAQMPDAASLTSFDKELHGKLLMLRSFSDDAVSRYNLIGDQLHAETPRLLSFGFFIPDHLDLDKSQLVITGKHALILRGDAMHPFTAAVDRDNVRISIGLGSPATPVSLSSLKEQLFFVNPSDGLALVPAYLRDLVPGKAHPSKPTCDSCMQQIRDGEWKTIPIKDPAFKHAVLTKSNDPEFPVHPASGFTATSELALVVDENGVPKEIWLARSAGGLFDDASYKAVSLYRFKAATYAGKPVASVLATDVKFESR